MLPEGLSMLWETTDPESALHRRFGFAGLGAAGDWLATQLAAEWGIGVHRLRRLVISSANAISWVSGDHGDLVVKLSQSVPAFPGLAATAELLGRLGAEGLPVAVPLPATGGRRRVVLDGPSGPLSVAVLPELAGDWLDVGDPVAVHAAGACLARLHLALRDHTDERLWRPDQVEPLDRRIGRWLDRKDPAQAPGATARLVRGLAGLPAPEDDRQPVHNDFRAANLLVRDRRIVGLLDFDDLAFDHPVSDLAKAGVYLSTLFTDWGPTTAAARDHLRTGYTAVRPLGPLETRWLEVLTLWQSIMAVPTGPDPAGWGRAADALDLPSG